MMAAAQSSAAAALPDKYKVIVMTGATGAIGAEQAQTSSGGGEDNTAGTVILVIVLVLLAIGAVVAVRKGWVKPVVQRLMSMVGGGSDASAYIRNHDSARGSTAPMSAAGLGASFAQNPGVPAGASTYNPPA